MDLTFFIPRTDFTHNEDYDLLDAILVTYGFHDEGVVQFGEHAFRKYWLSADLVEALPYCTDFLPLSDDWDHYLSLYSEPSMNILDVAKIRSYGIELHTSKDIGDKVICQYSIYRNCLYHLSKICPNGPKPTRRMVEEHSYFKFLDRGCIPGMDLADWFSAEWECQERLNTRLLSLAVIDI